MANSAGSQLDGSHLNVSLGRRFELICEPSKENFIQVFETDTYIQ